MCVCVCAGVLQELGLEQECSSQQEGERYVVKMDQDARARIDDLIQEAHRNTYTLYILVHDHAHWDISRWVCAKLCVQLDFSTSNRDTTLNPSMFCVCVCARVCVCMCVSSGPYSGTGDAGLGLVDRLLNSPHIRDAPNILTLHVTSFPFALQTQHTRISPYNEIHWPSVSNNVRHTHAHMLKLC